MKRISTIVLAVLFIVTLPGIAHADPLEPVTVLWDGTGAANLPCPAGAHWTFDQGAVEGNGIYNVTIHLGPDGYAGWGMAFPDAASYPRTFSIDTAFSLDASTYVDYSYTSEESASDDHLVLESCLGSPPDPVAAELAEVKAQLSAARARVSVLEDAVARALAVRGNAHAQVKAMRVILRGVQVDT